MNERFTLQTVNQASVHARMEALAQSWDTEAATQRWNECGRNVLQSVSGPFGLGKLVSAYDQMGGHVDTIHNARAGVFATADAQAACDAQPAYEAKHIHGHRAYVRANAAVSQAQKAGTLTDAYTGQRFRAADRQNPQRKMNLDHVISAKEIHHDAGRVLAGLNTPDLANTATNLRTTSASVNKSKKALSADQFRHKLDQTAASRAQRIRQLQKAGARMTPQDRAELTKLRALNRVDTNRLAQADAHARSAYNSTLNRSYYGSSGFAKKASGAAAKEGARAAAQRALGVVLVEFFACALHEIRDWEHKGRQHHSLMAELQHRLARVAKACMAKLDQALAALGQGFVSGFLSNLVTTLVNVFTTTTMRFMRTLREGAQALLGALKVLLAPAGESSWQQRMHESSKLMLAGGMVVGGIALEEWLSVQLAAVAWLAPMAHVLVAAITGAVVAMGNTFVLYLVDKADLLGVLGQARLDAVGTKLEQAISARETALRAQIASSSLDHLLALDDLAAPQSL